MSSDVTERLVIAERFRGPTGSANGGYICGRLAAFIGKPAEVTLRTRPPLGRSLDVHRDGDNLSLFDGDTLVAEGGPAETTLEAPNPVAFEKAAEIATPLPPGGHPYPECFVCGPLREPRDGLCIYPAELEGHGLVAAPWIPDDTLAHDDGVIEDVFMWAALDCPSGFASFLLAPGSTIILGRLAAKIVERVSVGERLVTVAWPVDRDGRKLLAGSAIFSEQGHLKGLAQATWIELPT